MIVRVSLGKRSHIYIISHPPPSENPVYVPVVTHHYPGSFTYIFHPKSYLQNGHALLLFFTCFTIYNIYMYDVLHITFLPGLSHNSNPFERSLTHFCLKAEKISIQSGEITHVRIFNFSQI